VIRDDDQIRVRAERFQAAAFDGSWEHALEGLAEATGSRSGQLIGLGAEAAVPFNLATNIDPALLAEFAEVGGGDPNRNPRIRAGFNASELEVLSDRDYIEPEDLTANDLYADYYVRHDIPFIVHTNLVRRPDSLIGLAVLRSKGQGHAEAAQRSAFATLAQAAHQAVRLQLALEGQGAQLIAGAFESLNIAAFVCDASGRVRALSPAAELLTSDQRYLSLSKGRLRARHAQDEAPLASAIARASGGWRAQALASDVIVRGVPGEPLLLLQVAPLPRTDLAFRLQAAILVVVRQPKDPAGRAPMLQAHFGLTHAEAQIAVALSRGRNLAAVAAERRVSIGTLRSQLKSIFSKMGVGRQAELTARVNEL
jgi:DNA-binding CsgD family transcriptional regulator/PAS domain-containing protein